MLSILGNQLQCIEDKIQEPTRDFLGKLALHKLPHLTANFGLFGFADFRAFVSLNPRSGDGVARDMEAPTGRWNIAWRNFRKDDGEHVPPSFLLRFFPSFLGP